MARRRRFAWPVLLALLSVLNQPASAQLTDSSLAKIGGGFRVYPGSFWSSTMGVGIGVGYKFGGITGSTSSLLLVAKPSIHRGIYEASYVTRDPHGGTPYLGAAAYYEDTGRTRFYGVGPFSTSDRVFIKDRFLRLRLRGGIPLERGRWVLQPLFEFVAVRVDSFRNDDPDAFERMLPDSRAVLLAAEAADAPNRWAGAGLEAGRYFARDPARSGSSVQAGLVRMEPLTDQGSGFWRLGAMALMDEAVGPRRFIARIAFATLFGSNGDVPYYLLPRLGGKLLPGVARYRFRGNSLLALNAGVEQPLFNVYGYAGVDLVLMAGVGSVYDDLSSQFTSRISFSERISPGGRAPLRSSGAAGFRLYVGERPLEVTVLVGLSAERMSVVTFRVHRDIRHRRGLLFR